MIIIWYRIHCNLFIILLKCSQILSSFIEFTFFHTLSNKPMDKRTLGKHHIKLIVNARKHICNRCRVRQHTARTWHLGQISIWNNRWWLVVDTALESCWTPIDKLNRALVLDLCNTCRHILWYHVTTVHQAHCHVLARAWITLGHHVLRLKHRIGNLWYRMRFMVSLFWRNHWRVRAQQKVDTWVWHQIDLKLIDVHVECTFKTQRCCQRGNHLRNQAIQVAVRWTLNTQVLTADVVDCFVVKHKCYISVLQERMGCQR
mmetsp:Transcript_20830/g.31029  ORF Transcript_20830/g.31029 Transcript_20830/m.31029 type:complete len:259 (+) Transcript_20830:98-874(+)